MEKDFSYNFYSSTVNAWQAMYQDILGAYKSIYWEIYTFVDDEAGNNFIDLLCEKARQGVEVKIIIDGFGSMNLSQISLNRLKSAGVDVQIFNRLNFNFNLKKLWYQVWFRTHCKVLIVDQESAFIGGVNVNSETENWDDLHLMLKGKVVRQLQRYFGRKYIRCGGKHKNVRHLLHPKLHYQFSRLKKGIRFVLHSPQRDTQRSPFRAFFRQAAKVAKHSITLLTPYYAPDRRFLELIFRAHRKGVKINVVMPYMSDVRLMHYMARAFYGISKKAGVVFHFLKKMNHGKAIIVDEKIAMIGSANITPRSFGLNHEAGVVFDDQDMIGELNTILDNWKSQADSNYEQNFKYPNKLNKIKSWLASRIKNYV